MSFRIRFAPEQLLSDFIDREYIPVAGRRRRAKHGQPMKSGRIEQLRYFVRLFKAYLHRPPTVADVKPETLAAFEAWHREAFPRKTGAWFGIDCRALLRFIALLPDQRKRNGRIRRELSEAPDTLWGICLDEYFVKNLRIRSGQTKRQYRTAIADFAAVLGHDPRPADLTDDNLTLMVRRSIDSGLAAKTVNERASRVKALWTWLAKKRRVAEFPFVHRIKEPRRIPRAWTRNELVRLFASCRQEPGYIVEGIKAADWWIALSWFQWSTGERIGAILSCRWDWIDVSTGHVEIPAEHRKGGFEDFLHRLRPEALSALEALRPAGFPLVFPWARSQNIFYRDYKGILKRAGLPFDRRCMTHKMRRSVATHLQAQGIEASIALGHSSPGVTRASYLDPRLIVTRGPSDALFNPEAGGVSKRLRVS